MYVPAAFREERHEVLDDTRGAHGTLLGHLARANRHWHAFSDEASGPASLVTFQGPHAYVSPSWYEAEVAVPTWNYVAVHAYGRPRIVDDPSAVHRILRQTVDTHES